MQQIAQWIDQTNQLVHGIVWGPVMVIFMIAVGIYFTVGTGFFQIRKFGLWMRCTLFAIFGNKSVHNKKDPYAISQFQAMSTALAGTMGTGNIVGVATALVAGGLGAVFWMWVSAVFGMMTKYAENVLGHHYRYKNKKGEWIGGPMVYIERGLGSKLLAAMFSVFCILASFGMGNMTQANSISGALYSSFGLSPLAVGIVVMLLSGLVILGGIKRIASFTEKFVPLMSVLYIIGGVYIIWRNRALVPIAFEMIFKEAFSTRAVSGGVGGYVFMHAVRFGVARGIFSNEAGLGSSVIVSAAANVKEPVQQGMWGIFEVFVDTIVSCTITALVIITSGSFLTGGDGAELSIIAFSDGFGVFGEIFASVAITFFAFATIVGWSYYGERAVSYLFGDRPVWIYRMVYIILTCVGCVANMKLVWSISDTFNGLMAIPNLLAVLFLSKKVFALTKDYLVRRKKGQLKI